MTRSFKSKVDAWIAVVALGPGLLIVPIVALVVWRAGEMTLGTGIVLALVWLIGIGLPLWVFLSTTYEITEDTLRVRSGPLRDQVRLKDITHVATSGSWESAPALSLRRLRITFAGGRTVMISPADERGFLATLSRAGVKAAQGVSPND